MVDCSRTEQKIERGCGGLPIESDPEPHARVYGLACALQKLAAGQPVDTVPARSSHLTTGEELDAGGGVVDFAC